MARPPNPAEDTASSIPGGSIIYVSFAGKIPSCGSALDQTRDTQSTLASQIHNTGRKPFSKGRDALLKQNRGYALAHDQQWGSVMWAFIENMYREYCLARLQEMRKYELSH